MAILGVAAAACGPGDHAARPDTAGAAAGPAANVVASAPVQSPADTSSRKSTSAPRPTARGAATAAAPAPRSPRHVEFDGIDLTGVGYDRGNVDAPVVVVDFSDFGCPYCAQFALGTYPSIDREYVQSGKVLFKYVPFIIGTFPHSAEATRAVECAAEQGQFWGAMDSVYAVQTDWKRGGDPRAVLAGRVASAGTDTARWSACYADRHTDRRTARASTAADRLGVRVTPSFLVNDRPVQGAPPLADFRRMIEAALLIANMKK